jgi:hypothetical protein
MDIQANWTCCLSAGMVAIYLLDWGTPGCGVEREGGGEEGEGGRNVLFQKAVVRLHWLLSLPYYHTVDLNLICS